MTTKEIAIAIAKKAGFPRTWVQVQFKLSTGLELPYPVTDKRIEFREGMIVKYDDPVARERVNATVEKVDGDIIYFQDDSDVEWSESESLARERITKIFTL